VPTFSKIVAATDFSEDSNLALSYAQELATRFSAELVVLHVDQPLAPVMMTPELGPAMDIGAMGRIAEEQRMLAQKELDKIAGNLRTSGLKVKSLLKVGSPFLEILHTAQSEVADLIVPRHARSHRIGARPDGQRGGASRTEGALPGPDDSSSGSQIQTSTRQVARTFTK